jgi:hypothetical protein
MGDLKHLRKLLARAISRGQYKKAKLILKAIEEILEKYTKAEFKSLRLEVTNISRLIKEQESSLELTLEATPQPSNKIRSHSLYDAKVYEQVVRAYVHEKLESVSPYHRSEIKEQLTGLFVVINNETSSKPLDQITVEEGDRLRVVEVDRITAEHVVKLNQDDEVKYTAETLQEVQRGGTTLQGILVALDGYQVQAEDIGNGETDYEIWARNTDTGKIESHYVQNNSVFAVTDKALRREGKTPEYEMQSYVDSDTGKVESGLILDTVKEYKKQALDVFDDEKNIGMLMFVNSEEPGGGSIDVTKLAAKIGQRIHLGVVRQGWYQGDFGDCATCVPLNESSTADRLTALKKIRGKYNLTSGAKKKKELIDEITTVNSSSGELFSVDSEYTQSEFNTSYGTEQSTN